MIAASIGTDRLCMACGYLMSNGCLSGLRDVDEAVVEGEEPWQYINGSETPGLDEVPKP